MERYVATQFYKADSPESRILRESGIAPSEFVLAADAQATIAALQARLEERQEFIKDCDIALDRIQAPRTNEGQEELVSTWRRIELVGSLLSQYRSTLEQMSTQLTQRTAELEAVNDKVQFLEKKNRNLLDSENLTLKVKADQDVRLASLQAELERVRADNKALDEWRADVTVSLQRPGGAFFVDVPQHIKDLVKERDDLRTLLLALPKVEGEIVIDRKGNGTEAGRLYAYVSIQTESYYRLYTARFSENEHADSYAALLQHRQGMEG